MPIFEFECEKCGERKEIIVLNNEFNEIQICENCKNIMKKVISTTNFKLKGKGWYKDGYQKN